MTIVQKKTEIILNSHLVGNYYKLVLNIPKIARQARPGQFVHIRLNDGCEPLLRRPFSIHRLGSQKPACPDDSHQQVGETRNQKLKIRNLIQEVKEKAPRGMKIEIEVGNLREFKEALNSRPDIIMLDNMNLRYIKKAVKIRDKFHPSVKLEVSGRVSLKNIREIAKTGVEMVSIGSLTHSAKSLDISLEVK